MLRIVAISDTHEHHDLLTLPEGDLLIFAGDFSMMGEDIPSMEFIRWLEDQARHYTHGCIFIAGNHDYCLEEDGSRYMASDLRYLANAFLLNRYLNHSGASIEHEGETYSIFGSPYSCKFGNWAFMKTPREMKEAWAEIPDNTDILITHGPPFGTLDSFGNSGPLGCSALEMRLHELKNLKLHIFGHIHSGYGAREREVEGHKVTFVNASQCGEPWEHQGPGYPAHNRPIVIDMDKRGVHHVESRWIKEIR